MAKKKSWFRRKSWDNQTDKYWGPLTYNSAPRSFRPLAVNFSSGGDNDDDYCSPGNSLRFSGFGRTLIVALPAILRPWRQWVDTSHYDWNKDSPTKGYWDIHAREYGFSCSDGHLSFSYGAQTGDSTTDQSRGYFLPWTQWHHVRRSYYNPDGSHAFTEPSPLPSWRDPARDVMDATIKAVPRAFFLFADYDGEQIIVRTRIEERESSWGVGSFRWLRWFTTNRISRSLDLWFSSEVGDRKGSYKGGTLGHSIEMEPGELPEAAFRRYCDKRGLTFIGPVPPEAWPEKPRSEGGEEAVADIAAKVPRP